MTRKAFVIGHPIAHSKSPLIHGTWIAQYGIDGSYEAIDVAPADLPAFFSRMRAGSFVGGNVTIPHKEAVFALCDTVEPLARTIGAVNTVTVSGGAISGRNTDYLGFLGNLDEGAPGWRGRCKQAVILGAGGAARAIAVALAEAGLGAIAILNRSAAKAHALAATVAGPATGGPLSEFTELAPTTDLLVNTTAIGMHGTRFDDLPLDRLPRHAIVTDIVYMPLVTPLLADASTLGLETVDGLGMLLHQAVPGFEAWFGVRPEVTAALRAKVVAAMGQ